jgi:hypothetical protein
MKCIKCENEIKCKLSISTEERDRPILIAYQWWSCSNCDAKYFAILEDSKVNIFDDTLLHEGYLVEKEKWLESLNWALKCPEPHNVNCKCKVHREVPPPGLNGISAWYTNE